MINRPNDTDTEECNRKPMQAIFNCVTEIVVDANFSKICS